MTPTDLLTDAPPALLAAGVDPATRAAGKAFLGALNAGLNSLSTVLLLAAYVSVQRKLYRAHGTFMVAAVVTSALFLVFYLSSYYLYGDKTTGLPRGSALYVGYLIILIPHVLLAIGMLPLIALALWRAYKRNWTAHTRVSVPAFWVWLYVSVTGVVVYFLLYHVFPTVTA